MFNFSFDEILLIVVMALIVLRPKDLPKVARFLHHWVKRIRRQVSEVQADIRREIQVEDAKGLEEAKSIHREFAQMGRETGAAFRSAARGMSEETEKIRAEAMRGKGDELKNSAAKSLPAGASEKSPAQNPAEKVKTHAQEITSKEYQDLDKRVRRIEARLLEKGGQG